MAATSQQKLAALKRLAASRQGQARDAIGRFAASTSGQQGGASVRKEIYKVGIQAGLHAAGVMLPHADLAAGLVANVTDAAIKKVVGTDQADAIVAQAGKTLGESTHTPEDQGLAHALNAAMAKFPELAAKMGTAQLLGHGIQAAMVHGLHMDAGASAMVAHVAAATIEPHARKMAADLYNKLKHQAKQKYAAPLYAT